MKIDKYKVSRPNGYLEEHSDGGYENDVYTKGDVITKHGLVTVYAEKAYIQNTIYQWYTLTFVYKGYCYQTTGNKYYKPRYLVTLADWFARKVVSDEKMADDKDFYRIATGL